MPYGQRPAAVDVRRLASASTCLGGVPLGFCGEPRHKYRLCRFMALSWLNLPCGPKAAIGYGKRTLATLASLPRHRGRSKASAASAFA